MTVHVLSGGAIIQWDSGGAELPWARVDERFNVLGREDWPPLTPGRLVVWSGWAEPDPAGGSEPATPLWGRAVAAAFEARCDGLATATAGAGTTVLLRPHARHVLSDIPSCTSFLRRRAGSPFGLLLEPCALLTASMVRRAEDHLARIADALGDHPAVAAIMLTNIRAEAEDNVLRPAPLDNGLIAPEVIVSAFHNHLTDDRVLVLLNEDVDGQLAVLGRG